MSVFTGRIDGYKSVFKIETFQLLMPAETRIAISLNSTETLRKLAEAKKVYDDIFTDIYSGVT